MRGMSREIISWNPVLETGIALVDAQHRSLIEILNDAAGLAASGSSSSASQTEKLRERLTEFADTHFRTEEKWMDHLDIAVQSASRHKAAHLSFIRKIDICFHSLRSGQGNGMVDVLAFLSSWLITHILGEDQAFTRQVNAIKGGLTPDRAYREAGGFRTDPSQEAVTEVISGLFEKLLTPQPPQSV
jgi:hemerythrin-like metal-binding protein